LKVAAKAWDRNLSNLAKLALAGLYHQTNRDGEAIDLYNALAAKPSDTVSAQLRSLTWRICMPRPASRIRRRRYGPR